MDEIEYKYIRGTGWVAQYKTKYVTYKADSTQWTFKSLEGIARAIDWDADWY